MNEYMKATRRQNLLSAGVLVGSSIVRVAIASLPGPQPSEIGQALTALLFIAGLAIFARIF